MLFLHFNHINDHDHDDHHGYGHYWDRDQAVQSHEHHDDQIAKFWGQKVLKVQIFSSWYGIGNFNINTSPIDIKKFLCSQFSSRDKCMDKILNIKRVQYLL